MYSNNTVYVAGITAGVITGGRILVGIMAGILSEQGRMRMIQDTENNAKHAGKRHSGGQVVGRYHGGAGGRYSSTGSMPLVGNNAMEENDMNREKSSTIAVNGTPGAGIAVGIMWGGCATSRVCR